MNLKEEIGRRLKAARTEAGYTTEYLSKQTKGLYSTSRLGNYEQGTRELPIEAAKIIAPILGCTASWLLCVDEDSTLPPDEKALLDNYRASNDQGKRSISSVAEAQSEYVVTKGNISSG